MPLPPRSPFFFTFLPCSAITFSLFNNYCPTYPRRLSGRTLFPRDEKQMDNAFINPSKKYFRYSLYVLLFLAMSYALCLPLLQELYLSGRDDWDYFFFLHEISSISLFEYGQFPLWNPYSGGGMPLIGNPQTGYLSPVVFLTSLFGVCAGLKISVWLHTFLGLLGMWLLSGHLGIKGPARLAPSFIFMLSSSWAIHMAAGQIVWLSAAFLPLFFLTFLKGLENKQWLLLSAIFESLMFYEGGTYVFAFSILFVCLYTIFLSLEIKSWQPIFAFIVVNIITAALSAPKLLPVLDMLGSHPRPTAAENAFSWYNYIGFLINRFSTFDCDSVDFDSYFGIAVVLFYLFSLSLYKIHRALITASLLMLLVSLGNFAKFSPWSILHGLPVFSGFYRGPTRSLIVSGFAVALLVGLYLGTVEFTAKRRDAFFVCLIILYFAEFSPWKIPLNGTFFSGFKHPTLSLIVFGFSIVLLVGLHLNSGESPVDRRTRALVSLVVLFIGMDLFLVSSRIFAEALKPSNAISVSLALIPSTSKKFSAHFSPQLYHVSPADTTRLRRSVASFHQPFSQMRIPGIERNFHGAWSDQYLPLLQNKGVVDAYETIPFERNARAVNDKDYRGEYYLLGKGEASLLDWSPNKFVYHVTLQEKDRLVINQNFWPGWHASHGLLTRHDGLLAIDLPPGEYDVAVTYLPRPFLIGVCIFLAAVAGIIEALFVSRKSQLPHP